jgi:hypothetical protein
LPTYHIIVKNNTGKRILPFLSEETKELNQKEMIVAIFNEKVEIFLANIFHYLKNEENKSYFFCFAPIEISFCLEKSNLTEIFKEKVEILDQFFFVEKENFQNLKIEENVEKKSYSFDFQKNQIKIFIFKNKELNQLHFSIIDNDILHDIRASMMLQDITLFENQIKEQFIQFPEFLHKSRKISVLKLFTDNPPEF